jgi:hypothetical protein
MLEQVEDQALKQSLSDLLNQSVLWDGVEPNNNSGEEDPVIDWDNFSPEAKEHLHFALLYAGWYNYYKGRTAGLIELGDQIELLAQFVPGNTRIGPSGIPTPGADQITQVYNDTIIHLGTRMSEAGANASRVRANNYWLLFLGYSGNRDARTGEGANGFPTTLIDPAE